MIVIYQCFGGAHSSVLAAAIHTHMLPVDRIPAGEEIINLPFYDKTPDRKIGVPLFFGTDEFQNKIFIQGLGKAKKIVPNVLESFLQLEGISTEKVYLKNTLQYVTLSVRLGGFLSRGLGMVFPGRLITVYGLKKSYPRFVEMVKRVKKEIAIA